MFEIGEMLRLNDAAKEKGKWQAISAWEQKKPGKSFFSGNIPKDSNDYQDWLKHISNSVGYCLEIDGQWAKVQFMHLNAPFWIKCDKLEICK